MDPLLVASRIAASGLQAQSMRMRVISENLANVDSTAKLPGGDPYRRKLVAFDQVLDGLDGPSLVGVKRIFADDRPFEVSLQPSHPAADERGYVKLPNVNMMIEMADMREAGRAYEANLQIMKQSRDMVTATIDLLRRAT